MQNTLEKEDEDLDSVPNIQLFSANKLLKQIEIYETILSKAKSKNNINAENEWIIEKMTQLGILYNKQGFIYFQQNKYEKAEAFFNKAKSLLSLLIIRKKDSLLFLELSTFQNLGYLYKKIGKKELAFDIYFEVFSKPVFKYLLESKYELIIVGMDTFFSNFGGVCVQMKKYEIGLQVVLIGIEYLQRFYAGNYQYIFHSLDSQKKKNTLAYLYFLASQIYLSNSQPSYEKSRGFLIKACDLSKEIFGESSQQTIKFQKKLETLKKKIDFENKLNSEVPESFEDFCNGIEKPAIGNLSQKNNINEKTRNFLTNSSTSRNKNKISRFLKIKPDEIFSKTHSFKNFKKNLHKRTLTTLSSISTNNTQYAKRALGNYDHLNLSPLSLSHFKSKNLSDFMTQRPNSSKKFVFSLEKPSSKQQEAQAINTQKDSTPKSKGLTTQLSNKTITSASSLKSQNIESIKTTRIATGQVLKHSFSLKKADSKKAKDRRFSESIPVGGSSNDERKVGLSLFANQFNGIEEEQISIIGSMSEISESENNEYEDNVSRIKSKSSQKAEILSNSKNTTPKNEMVMTHEINSSQYRQNDKTKLVKKQTLEIPFLTRSRSRGPGSLSENASSNSNIKEEEPLNENEIKRIKTETLVQNSNEEIKDGEISTKSQASNATSKFINKIFRTFFLRKFNKMSSQKIKEIEEGDSPIIKVIDDMRIFPRNDSETLSSIAIQDILFDNKIFPLKYFDEKGRPSRVLSFEAFLYNKNNKNDERMLNMRKMTDEALIPMSWSILLKVSFENFSGDFGCVFKKHRICSFQSQFNGFRLVWKLFFEEKQQDILENQNERTYLRGILENLIEQDFKYMVKVKRCSGISLRKNEICSHEYKNFLKNHQLKCHNLSTTRDTSIKNYLQFWNLDKQIVNPDVSKDFSIFFDNFTDKLQRFSNLQSFFSPEKKKKPLARMISQQNIEKTQSSSSIEHRKKAFPFEIMKEFQSHASNSNGSLEKKEVGKNIQKEQIEKKESSKTPSFSSSPLTKEKEVFSSIKDIPAGSQTSFLSRNALKKMEFVIQSTGSLKSYEHMGASQKELKKDKNTASLANLLEEDEEPRELKLFQNHDRSPRRKTIQISKNLNFPTIQSLFNLEDIEGSPKKSMSPVHGHNSPNIKTIIKESFSQLENLMAESKKNQKKIDYLCNNKDFVELFFSKFKKPEISRYSIKKPKIITNLKIFVEKPFVFPEENNIFINFYGEYETIIVFFAKPIKNILEIRLVKKNQYENKNLFWLSEEDFQDFANNLSIYFYVHDKRLKTEISFLDFFSKILNVVESDDPDINHSNKLEALNILKYFLWYKKITTKTIFQMIEFLNIRIRVENETITFLNSPPQKQNIKKISTNRNICNSSFSNFTLDLAAIPLKRKFYLKIHLKKSIRYLRIEVFWKEKIMKIAFYDPLQGKKDYVFISSQQKQEFQKIERVIKQKSLHLMEKILSQNLSYIQELVGKKLYLFRDFNNEFIETSKETCPNIKLLLISNSKDENLKKFFYKKILYEVYKIKKLGKSYIKITILKPNNLFRMDYLKKSNILYFLEIYPFNKRFSIHKFIFTNEDFPEKNYLDNERAVLNYINKAILNKVTYMKTLIYKKLAVPKFYADPKYSNAYFVEKMNFEKQYSFKDSLEDVKPKQSKFLKNSCLIYNVIFQSIKKIGDVFSIVSIKKHLSLGYWVVDFYFPKTNRTLKCFVRNFDPIFDIFETSQSIKSWTQIIRKIKLKKSLKNLIFCLDSFQGVIRESLFEEIVPNKHYGLMMTEWFIENVKHRNYLNAIQNFGFRKSENFRLFLRITFLNENLIFNEKICLRDLIYSNIEYKPIKSYTQCNIIKIMEFYGKKLSNKLRLSFDLRFFRDKAFKTRLFIEDPQRKPSLKITKDKRIEGFFDLKYIVLIEKVLSIKPKQIITILWIEKTKEFYLMVVQNTSCRKILWKVPLLEMKEKINFIENFMSLKLYVELGNRILSVVRNKILISTALLNKK